MATVRDEVRRQGESGTLDRQRFGSLWSRCCIDGRSGGAGGAFDQLLDGYCESTRAYHTPGHIAHCLAQFDLASAHMDDPDAVEMALWFHDVIYDIEAKDNELRSARLFESLSADCMPEPFRRKVFDLIMVTTHRGTPATPDEGFMVDIDLSSFGQPWDAFMRDNVAVRNEAGAWPDEDFYPRQRAFMHHLLDRTTFCYTEFFRQRHEAQARENIRRHLHEMEQRGLT